MTFPHDKLIQSSILRVTLLLQLPLRLLHMAPFLYVFSSFIFVEFISFGSGFFFQCLYRILHSLYFCILSQLRNVKSSKSDSCALSYKVAMIFNLFHRSVHIHCTRKRNSRLIRKICTANIQYRCVIVFLINQVFFFNKKAFTFQVIKLYATNIEYYCNDILNLSSATRDNDMSIICIFIVCKRFDL